MKAKLSNFRQSPRKVRLLADLVRGKGVDEALNSLTFAAKKASEPMTKLIRSAVANAKNTTDVKAEDLYIKTITVDKGIVFKRFMPRAHGRATPIRRRNSHIEVELGNINEKVQTK